MRLALRLLILLPLLILRRKLLRLAALVAIALALFGGRPLPAQDLASLVADSVSIAGNDTLVAQGHVEVFYQGRRLQASRIVYDRQADKLHIDGPILLKDDSGSFIIADQADLSADLENGVLISARLVLNQQLQLASSEMMRIGGRYTALGRSVVSSCKICASNPTPLWEIRARRIVHDEQERQIYFDSAQLRLAGVPVAYIPRLRIPDPTLNRAQGVLRPSIRTTSDLGTGLKIPYFIPLGPSRDLTLTPYVSTKSAQTLELRYRQAFRTGSLEFNGAISRDRILPDETRYYGNVAGIFALPRDFVLTFSAEAVSDRAYLLDYGISGKDRIDSRLEVARTRRNEYISGRIVNFRSIRAGELNSTLPSIITDTTWERRFAPDLIGGTASLRFQSHSHYRSSTSPLDPDGDTISDGRDTGRLSLRADWQRNWVLPAGVLASVMTELNADAYNIRQDLAFQGHPSRVAGGAAVEFRWPWVRSNANGVSQMIEPVAQFVWAPKRGDNIPNEDSRLVEFDEGNLFSFDRFPGNDAVERGPRANIGLSYTRIDSAGWSMGVTMGRVFRDVDYGQFGVASGLDGKRSDWLAALQLSVADGLTLTNRLVFADDFTVTKTEFRLDMQRRDFGLTSNYVLMQADPTENRATRVSELTLDGRYQFTEFWQGRLTTRYDFEADRAQSAGVTFGFKNECLALDLSLSRRFTSSASVSPTTNFGLSVDLLGFGGKAAAGPSRACRS